MIPRARAARWRALFLLGLLMLTACEGTQPYVNCMVRLTQARTARDTIHLLTYGSSDDPRGDKHCAPEDARLVLIQYEYAR